MAIHVGEHSKICPNPLLAKSITCKNPSSNFHSQEGGLVKAVLPFPPISIRRGFVSTRTPFKRQFLYTAISKIGPHLDALHATSSIALSCQTE